MLLALNNLAVVCLFSDGPKLKPKQHVLKHASDKKGRLLAEEYFELNTACSPLCVKSSLGEMKVVSLMYFKVILVGVLGVGEESPPPKVMAQSLQGYF